jgi:hypothetical protein
MPNWLNFWNDAAYWVNWTLYASCIVLLSAVIPALAVTIVSAFVMIGRQTYTTITTRRHEIKELEKLYESS